jgi:ABC-2 type transport system ATP-binding protein
VEEEGLACMISSHRLEEIEALHSHVLLLDKGRIRYDGDLDELRDLVERHQLEIEFRTDESARQARKLIENAGVGESTAVEGGLLTASLGSNVSTGEVLSSLEPVVGDVLHLREVERPLRDILADMYREHEDS